MKRIMIVGSGGSGKSHLARELGRRLGIAVTHLDALNFDANWNRVPSNQFASAQRELVAGPEWIVDGNSNSTMAIRLERADTVIVMDVSTPAALWGVVSRHLRHGAGQHTGGVYNRLNWEVIRYVAGYRKTMRPKVIDQIQRLAQPDATVIYLRSRAHTRHWLGHLSAQS